MRRYAGFIAIYDVHCWIDGVPRPPDWAPSAMAWPWHDKYWEIVYRRGILDLEIVALRLGVFYLDLSKRIDTVGPGEINDLATFKKAAEATGIRIRYLNALSICIHSACLIVDHFSSRACRVDGNRLITADDPSSYGGDSAYVQLLPTPDRTGPYKVISCAAIERAVLTFERVVSSTWKLSTHSLSLLNQALCSHQEYDYAASTTLAWTACEFSIRALAPGFNPSRKKGKVRTGDILRDLRSGDVDSNVLDKVLEAMKVRDSWLHNGREPTLELSQLCIEAARLTVNLYLGIEIVSQATDGLSI